MIQGIKRSNTEELTGQPLQMCGRCEYLQVFKRAPDQLQSIGICMWDAMCEPKDANGPTTRKFRQYLAIPTFESPALPIGQPACKHKYLHLLRSSQLY